MSHRFNQITPTDHFGWHAAYLEVYERMFDQFKDYHMRLLEIGTDGGGGLRMYRDYFPKGNIYGMDISPAPGGLSECGITHFQGDAYTKASLEWWRTYEGGFNIIIDDGPHTIGSQEFFVQNYPKLLTPDGIAIVEDIQEIRHVHHLAKQVPDGFFAMGIDLRHVNERYDDVLLAIWRK